MRAYRILPSDPAQAKYIVELENDMRLPKLVVLFKNTFETTLIASAPPKYYNGYVERTILDVFLQWLSTFPNYKSLNEEAFESIQKDIQFELIDLSIS